jgi:hypothetical protein
VWRRGVTVGVDASVSSWLCRVAGGWVCGIRVRWSSAGVRCAGSVLVGGALASQLIPGVCGLGWYRLGGGLGDVPGVGVFLWLARFGEWDGLPARRGWGLREHTVGS